MSAILRPVPTTRKTLPSRRGIECVERQDNGRARSREGAEARQVNPAPFSNVCLRRLLVGNTVELDHAIELAHDQLVQFGGCDELRLLADLDVLKRGPEFILEVL